MLIDSHCHLASSRFATEEIPAILARAHAAQVSRCVTLATTLDDIPAHLAIARHASVYACIGIHPCEVHDQAEDAVSQLSSWISDPRICGLGETGLDYFHPAPSTWSESAWRARQQLFLTQHFELAADHGLNLVIHTRDREGDTSLQDALAIYQTFSRDVRAVFHCFISTPANALRVIELGGLVSFGGIATFRNASQVRKTIRACPQASFMLETDAPYLAPEPHRGKRNEPAFVRLTAEAVAALRDESFETLATHTSQAAEQFFRFAPRSNHE